jgi:hypothetical protein
LGVVTADELRNYLYYLKREHIPHQNNPCRPASKSRMAIASVQSDWRILRTLWNFLDDEELLEDRQHNFFRRERVRRSSFKGKGRDKRWGKKRGRKDGGMATGHGYPVAVVRGLRGERG